jgi:DNA recombination protein RmuC
MKEIMQSEFIFILFGTLLVMALAGLTWVLINRIKSLSQELANIKQLHLDNERVQELKFEKYHGEMVRVMTQQFFQTQEKWQKEQANLKHDISGELKEQFIKIHEFLGLSIEKMTEKVNGSFNDSIKQATDTFQQIMVRLTKIDEAQKNIEHLSQNVVSLQEVLTDKKTRGIFGEVQLNHLLTTVFGEKNENIFQFQYSLSNKSIVDAILFLPDPIGRLCIDSKFPLENYRRLVELRDHSQNYSEALRSFKKDIKKHIDDISKKYIILNETADQAMMFVPAEAIFAELYAYHADLIEYAQSRRVWIAGPSTFMAILTTIQTVLNNIEQTKNANVIQVELKKLSADFMRYRKRWDNLVRHLDTVSKDAKEISTSTEMITKKFNKIADVKIDRNELDQTLLG